MDWLQCLYACAWTVYVCVQSHTCTHTTDCICVQGCSTTGTLPCCVCLTGQETLANESVGDVTYDGDFFLWASCSKMKLLTLNHIISS